MRMQESQNWDEVHRAIVPLMRANNSTNAFFIAREYFCIMITLTAATSIYRSWSVGALSSLIFVASSIVLVALVAAFQHRLSGLAHDASHGVLFKNRVANELISDIFLMFPIVAMTQRYRESHLGHHQFVNDPERDPDLRRLMRHEPFEFPISKPRFWLRYVLKSLYPPAILGYLFGRAMAANLHNPELNRSLRTVYTFRVTRVMRGTTWLTILAIVNFTNHWPTFFLYWVTPLLTFYPVYMLLREVAHHSNAPDAGDLTNSRIFRVHPVLKFAVFPYGQDFHLTHHLFAMVPHYRIEKAHQILEQYAPYREQVIVCKGYFFRHGDGPSVLELLSRSNPVKRPAPHAVRGRSTLRNHEIGF